MVEVACGDGDWQCRRPFFKARAPYRQLFFI